MESAGTPSQRLSESKPDCPSTRAVGGLTCQLQVDNWGLGNVPSQGAAVDAACRRPASASISTRMGLRYGDRDSRIWVQVRLSEYQGSRRTNMSTSIWQLGTWECFQWGRCRGRRRQPAGERWALRFRLEWASVTVWVPVRLSEYQGRRRATLPTTAGRRPASATAPVPARAGSL